MRNVFFKKGMKRANAGFTLIEILVVIGIIALLATIVIIAINPARQFAQARNTQRQSNINTILNGIGQNIADNKGIFTCPGNTTPLTPVSPAITIASTSIDNASGGSGGTPSLHLDLASCLTPTYVPTFPMDPTQTAGVVTGYTLNVDSLGRVLVCAPNANESALGNPGALCVKR